MSKAGKSKGITCSKEKTAFLKMAESPREDQTTAIGLFLWARELLGRRVQGTWGSLSLSSWHEQGTMVLWPCHRKGEWSSNNDYRLPEGAEIWTNEMLSQLDQGMAPTMLKSQQMCPKTPGQRKGISIFIQMLSPFMLFFISCKAFLKQKWPQCFT